MDDRLEDAQAVFLVGGLGSRLGHLTRTTPKPLMEVAARPFLHWLAGVVAGQGVRDLLFLAGHLAVQIEALAAQLRAEGLRVAVSVEPAPLGTGGALAHARAMLAERFFLLNGDSLFAIPLAELARPGQGDATASARLALRAEADVGRYGAVTVEGERVTGFTEKTGEPAGSGLINGGVYWMKRAALDGSPAGAFSLERDLFPRLAAAGRLEGRRFEAPFIDIGLPEALAQAQTVVPAAVEALRRA